MRGRARIPEVMAELRKMSFAGVRDGGPLQIQAGTAMPQ
jgi:hypothetical protein